MLVLARARQIIRSRAQAVGRLTRRARAPRRPTMQGRASGERVSHNLQLQTRRCSKMRVRCSGRAAGHGRSRRGRAKRRRAMPTMQSNARVVGLLAARFVWRQFRTLAHVRSFGPLAATARRKSASYQTSVALHGRARRDCGLCVRFARASARFIAIGRVLSGEAWCVVCMSCRVGGDVRPCAVRSAILSAAVAQTGFHRFFVCVGVRTWCFGSWFALACAASCRLWWWRRGRRSRSATLRRC